LTAQVAVAQSGSNHKLAESQVGSTRCSAAEAHTGFTVLAEICIRSWQQEVMVEVNSRSFVQQLTAEARTCN
jgi:hypothetical protein